MSTTIRTILPPHQHPFDWYIIPEIKGERGKDSYISYDTNSQVWKCEICQVGDHLSGSVEEHCHTWEHLQNERKLRTRREELTALVQQREKEIWAELKAKEEMERQAAEKAAAEEANNEHADVDAAYVAKQRQRHNDHEDEKKETEETQTAPVLQKKPRKWENIDHEVSNYYNSTSYRASTIRNRLLSEKFEDEKDFALSAMVPGESQHERIRRLRAQRLSGKKAPLGDASNVNPSSVESRREARLREKEAKRRAIAALTQEHLARQKIEDEEYSRQRAREAARKRFFDSFCGMDSNMFPEPVKKASSACTDFVGDTTYFCGLESTLVTNSDVMED